MKKVMYLMAAAAMTLLASCGNSDKAAQAAEGDSTAEAVEAPAEAAAAPEVNADELLAGKTVEAITENITVEQCLGLAAKLSEWGTAADAALRDQASKDGKIKAVEEMVNTYPFMARAYNVLKAVYDDSNLRKNIGMTGQQNSEIHKAIQKYQMFVNTAEFQDAGAPLENLADYKKL